MTYDLRLGFKSRPTGLSKVLASKGFISNRTLGYVKDGITCRTYLDGVDTSENGVMIDYHAGIAMASSGDTFRYEQYWFKFERPSKPVVAEAEVIGFCPDTRRLMDIAKFLRDHYGAILVNQQKGRRILS